jgi:hypothetical protein
MLTPDQSVVIPIALDPQKSKAIGRVTPIVLTDFLGNAGSAEEANQ